jgi:hypothetical protein
VKVASSIGVSDDSDLRAMLRKDEEYIYNTLRRVLDSEADKQAALLLQGDDAHRLLGQILVVGHQFQQLLMPADPL